MGTGDSSDHSFDSLSHVQVRILVSNSFSLLQQRRQETVLSPLDGWQFLKSWLD